MAKISDSQGRTDYNSGYVRVIGSPLLGKLLSRTQATVIRNGNELEKILKDKCLIAGSSNELDAMISEGKFPESGNSRAFFSFKVKFDDDTNSTCDIILIEPTKHRIHIVELKDGDTFDTKKASGELESINKIADRLRRVSGYECTVHFCAFNQPDKNAIVAGAKGRFTYQNAMTGEELCLLLGISYDEIIDMRRRDQQENFDYFLEELMKIPEVEKAIKTILKRGKSS
jgi:hypothetical protein